MVEPSHLKICSSKWNISPGRGENEKNIWNHHPVAYKSASQLKPLHPCYLTTTPATLQKKKKNTQTHGTHPLSKGEIYWHPNVPLQLATTWKLFQTSNHASSKLFKMIHVSGNQRFWCSNFFAKAISVVWNLKHLDSNSQHQSLQLSQFLARQSFSGHLSNVPWHRPYEAYR